ncbi:hypothetical protein PIB30_066989 [Stylosanthes scabra]|uniref:Uncharacterized protein n=1 Tax=Stylosanthes scabra TaxID=79078 RepID=A0ABU6RMD4_9FABA|nr:hypothetical protein [Stylosanthes scabra]
MDTTNLLVYHNGEVIRNTQEGVSFVYEFSVSISIPFTMTFAELQNGLCECIDGHVLKKVNQILYQMTVQIFGEAIHFDTMATVDEAEEDPEMDNEKQTVLEENLSNNEDELEANYEIGDKDEDDEEKMAIVD